MLHCFLTNFDQVCQTQMDAQLRLLLAHQHLIFYRDKPLSKILTLLRYNQESCTPLKVAA